MKKSIFITLIGIMLFGGCMINVPDYASDIKNEAQTEETTPKKEEEPATEETPTEPQAPEIKVTRTRTPPANVETETEEAESEETEEADTSSEVEEQKVVDWRAFYNRVLKKGQEKYNKKLPWNNLAKDAGLSLSSWMSDAGSCKRNPPTEEEVRKIADALGTSYEWLLYGEE